MKATMNRIGYPGPKRPIRKVKFNKYECYVLISISSPEYFLSYSCIEVDRVLVESRGQQCR